MRELQEIDELEQPRQDVPGFPRAGEVFGAEAHANDGGIEVGTATNGRFRWVPVDNIVVDQGINTAFRRYTGRPTLNMFDEGLNFDGRKEMDYFYRFFPMNFLGLMVDYTNTNLRRKATV